MRAVLVCVVAVMLVRIAPVRAESLICPSLTSVSRVAVDLTLDPLRQYQDAFAGAGVAWTTSPLAQLYAGLVKIPARSVHELRSGIDGLLSQLRSSNNFPAAAGSSSFLQTRLQQELTTLATALKELDYKQGAWSWDEFEGAGGRLARWQMTQVQNESCGSTNTWSSDTVLFREGTEQEHVVLAAQEMTPPPTGFATGSPIYFATVAQAIEARATVAAVHSLFSHVQSVSITRAHTLLTQIDIGWSNYLGKGFSQYPWEALLNSTGSIHWDGAPRTQIILLHPEAAMLVDTRRTQNSAASGALLVHGLGLLGYGGTQRSWFVGASATGAVTTREALGMGAGGTVHFGHTAIYSRVPHISLALLAFHTSAGRHGPFVGISADLWRLFSSDNEQSLFHSAAMKQQP